MSCHPEGSESDRTLCKMSSSKGSDGWKNSDIMLIFEPSSTPPRPMEADVPASSGAKGSVASTGAKLSNDRAVWRGAGDRDALVAGDAMLNIA